MPPDYFNQEGQNWGNPLYNWEAMKKDGYLWWRHRIARAIERFDYVRIDHFRSFSAFYAIPKGKSAKEGWWLPGAGKEFFEVLSEKLGPLPLLAEDLGFLDTPVHDLLKLTGYPGMLVYQFSADGMRGLSEEDARRKIFYTGTHDNDLPLSSADDIIEELYHSPAAWVITPLQDLLGLGNESRMNIPGKAAGNWKWRAEASDLSAGLADRLATWVSQSFR